MTTDAPNLVELRQSLVARFTDFGQRVRKHLLLEGAARVLATGAGLCLLSFLLDRSLRLAPFTRIGLLVIGLVILGIESWRHLVRPALLKLDPIDLAYAMDHHDGARGIAPRVATILELPQLLNDPAGPSPAMVEQAVLRSYAALGGMDLAGHLDERRRRSCVYAIAGVTVLSLILLLVRPSITGLWIRRSFFASSTPWPQKTYLSVAGLDGNTIIVPRGEPFSLRVTAKDGSVAPESVWLRFRENGRSREAANLTRFAANDFRYDFPSIAGDTEAELRGGDDVFGPFIIHPVDRPKIVDLELVAQHPTEPKPQTFHFSGEEADVAFLPRTRMELRFTANTPIAEAHVKSSTTQPSPAAVKRLDDRHFALAWEQESAVQLEIELLAAGANLTSVPTSVSIGLKTDKPPRATLAFSGVRPRITPQATIPLTADARDDYGIADMGLDVQTDAVDPADPKKFNRQNSNINLYGPQTPATELEVQQPYSLAVSQLKLTPGNLLSIGAKATDASYTGAQTGQSRQITFRIVSPEELFREIILRQQSERVKFRRQTDENRKLGESLATLSSAESIAQCGRQFRASQREINRIATSLAETLTEIRLNALGTPEAQELMDKNVIKPLKALNDELLNAQKDALDALQINDAAAVTAVQGRQEQIVARMEQILKQMSQWDSFVDVLNQLNEIIKLQGDVRKDTEQLKKTQDEGVFDK